MLALQFHRQAAGLLARRDPLLIEQTGDRTDAETVNGIALVHPSG